MEMCVYKMKIDKNSDIERRVQILASVLISPKSKMNQ